MKTNSGIFVRYEGKTVLFERVPIKAIPELVEEWDMVRTIQALVEGIQGYRRFIEEAEMEVDEQERKN